MTLYASRAVAEAKGARAERLAPYEFTAATEYLHKARDLAGYARYHDAIVLGQRAREWAKEATRIARDRGASADQSTRE